MEPIRPQVDAFVLDWLRRTLLQRKWFFEERDGNCRLTGEFVAQLSATSKLWRQALGPFAEWIAHSLWSISSQPSRTSAPATRLTQSRHLMTPKLGRLTARDPIAQARRADARRRQAAALSAWNPSDKPDWLDEKFYQEQVQPRMQTIQAFEIQAALSVSQPYALRIRGGQCISKSKALAYAREDTWLVNEAGVPPQSYQK